jgi:ribosomal protein L14
VIAPVVSVGAFTSGDPVVPRRAGEMVARGDSSGIKTHVPYKAKAATPRIRRSVILRAIDRRGARRIRKASGSTARIESAAVMLGSSGTMDGAAAALIEAAEPVLTESRTGGEFSIRRTHVSLPSNEFSR